MWGDVRLLINDAWSNLSDVHVDQQTVVTVDFIKFVLIEISGVDIVLDVHMLVWKDDIRVSVRISRCVSVVDSEVFIHFIFVKLEIIVAIGNNFIEDV
jgi:hypothetical protein